MKELANQAIRGSIAMTGAQVVANIASFIIVWAVARGLGDAAYGIFAAAYALATSIASLADSGVRMALIREVARVPESWKKLWGYAVSISLVLALIVSIVFIAVLVFAQPFAEQDIRLWLLGYALIWTLVRITLGVPAGQQRLVAVAMWSAFERMTGATLVACIVFSDVGSLLLVVQGLCALEFSVLLLLILWIIKQGWAQKEDVDLTTLSFAKVALPFGISAAAFAVLGRLDVIFLGFQQPPAIVGHYAAAQLLAMLGVFVGVSVSGALFPALSHLAKSKNKQELYKLLNPALGLLALVMLVLTVGLATLSEWMLGFIYGDTFVSGSNWLVFFALSAPLAAFNSMAGAVIGAWGWQARWAKVLWVVLLFVVPAYALAGSFFGVWGIAFVSVSIQVILAGVSWHWMREDGMVKKGWLGKLFMLLILLALLFVVLPISFYWISIPLALIGIFALRICEFAWIKMAWKVAR